MMTSLRSKLLTAAVVLATLLVSSSGSAQWVQTNGPWGATVNAFASIGSRLFVATDGGVFMSSDTGATWSARNEGLNNRTMLSLCVAGTTLFAAADSTIFISTNDGSTWKSADQKVLYVSALYGSDSTVYAVGDSLYRSNNFGATWTVVPSPLPWHVYFLKIGICGSTLLAATEYGVYRSIDSGVTWIASDSGITGNAGPLFVHDGTIYVSIGGVIGGIDVFRSTNCGVSWEPTPLTNTDIEAGFAAIGNTVFAGSNYYNKIYSSNDGGNTWVTHKEVLGGISDLTSFGGVLFVGKTYNNQATSNVSGFGVYRSVDSAKTWGFSSQGITKTTIRALATNGNTLFAGIDGGVRYSTDDGATWMISQFFGDRSINQIAVQDSNVVIFDDYDSITVSKGIYYSNDRGLSFKRRSTFTAREVLCLGHFDSNFFVGTDYGVFASSDNGKTWTRTQSAGMPTYPYVMSLAAVGGDLLACVADLQTGLDAGVYRSTNSGKTWESANVGLISMQADEVLEAGDTLFAAIYNHGMFRSTDSGTTWVSLSFVLGDSTYLLPVGDDNGHLFAAIESTSIGVQSNVSMSSDGGQTWLSISEGLGLDSANVTSLCISSGYLFAGTWGDGVWRRPLSEMIPTSAVAEQPKASGIKAQAYPNPFSEKTTIRFTCVERGPVHLSVVNLLGVEIARLFDGELDAGEHSFEWDANDEVAGTFFCLIREGAAVGAHHAVPMMLSR